MTSEITSSCPYGYSDVVIIKGFQYLARVWRTHDDQEWPLEKDQLIAVDGPFDTQAEAWTSAQELAISCLLPLMKD